MSASYASELRYAMLAVQLASIATKSILKSIDKGTLSKDDASPVTIADFAAQALLISAIHSAFPSDSFVGEESSSALRADAVLCERVWELVSETTLDDRGDDSLLMRPESKEEMMKIIDLGGKGQGGNQGRIWMLDPVDGTATFMKGEQYAVCLGLVVDGIQKVGVLGLPNQETGKRNISEEEVDDSGFGCLLSAVKGEGAHVRRLSRGALEDGKRIIMQQCVTTPGEVHVVIQRGDHTMDLERQAAVAEKLEATNTTELWAAQVRYSALIVGGGDFLVRIPTSRTKRVNTWDHIGGILIFEESGGKVTDLNGKEIDFGAGRKLSANWGIIAARANLYPRVLKAVREVIQGP